MYCQECQKRPATVHLTQIINHEQTVQHLCEQCARDKGEFSFDTYPPFSIQNLLTGLMNLESASQGQVVAHQAKVQCDNCGLTYAQFGQIGRFGCSRCYSTFGDRILPLLRRIHGSTQHVGKVPVRAGGMVKLRRAVEDLRGRMQKHISREEFEEAAILRDQIKQLEAEIKGGEDHVR